MSESAARASELPNESDDDRRKAWVESFPKLECPCCGEPLDIRQWLREAIIA